MTQRRWRIAQVNEWNKPKYNASVTFSAQLFDSLILDSCSFNYTPSCTLFFFWSRLMALTGTWNPREESTLIRSTIIFNPTVETFIPFRTFVFIIQPQRLKLLTRVSCHLALIVDFFYAFCDTLCWLSTADWLWSKLKMKKYMSKHCFQGWLLSF